jgi:hypothetical protein
MYHPELFGLVDGCIRWFGNIFFLGQFLNHTVESSCFLGDQLRSNFEVYNTHSKGICQGQLDYSGRVHVCSHS